MPVQGYTMTNRSKQAGGSAGSGGRGAQKLQAKQGMRFLDLSFEGREQARVHHSVNNGFRPHGGYRGSSGKHPPGIHSFNKPVDYQKQLQEDLDKLFDDDRPTRCNSPAWAINVSQEGNNTGESPLFVHKLLAPSKIDKHFGSVNFENSLEKRTRPKPTPKNNGVRFYRPNKTHQYLTKTELKNSTSSEVDVKLGKPTRTSLLRARQRCNSAPINGYETRREQMKKLEERDEYRRNKAPPLTIRDLLGESQTNGESLHSFLIGARYNRAHYLDAKSLTEQGVYMPRNNPLGCFVIRKSIQRPDSASSVPMAPPDSPASYMSDEEHEEYVRVRSPLLPPQPPSTPSKSQRQAWDDATKVEVSIAPDEGAQQPDRLVSEEKKPYSSMPVIEQIMNLDDGLNVKGKNFNNVRPKSARPYANQHLSYSTSRPSSAHPCLPAVSIQGHSINRIHQKPTPRDSAIDQTTQANNPPPPNTPHLAPDAATLGLEPHRLTPEPPAPPVPSQEEETPQQHQAPEAETTEKEADAVENKSEAVEVNADPEQTTEQAEEELATEVVKRVIEKVDKGINCPSVPSAPSVTGDAVLTQSPAQEETPVQKDNENAQAHLEAGETWPGGEERTEVEKKVRFADDLVQTSETDPAFFLTEENNEQYPESKEVDDPSSGDKGEAGEAEIPAEVKVDGTGEGQGEDNGQIDDSNQINSEDRSNDNKAAEPNDDKGQQTNYDLDAEKSAIGDSSKPTDINVADREVEEVPEAQDNADLKANAAAADVDVGLAGNDSPVPEDDEEGMNDETEAPPVISIAISPKRMSPVPSADPDDE